jgi:ATP-dependent Clp protease ATP-binding subunit ClpA
VFERFTDRARQVLTLAQEEARLLNHSFIGTEHILLGLIREEGGVGAEALRSLGISLEAVRVKVEEAIGIGGTEVNGSPPFTPRAKKVLELSLREALQMNHSDIGTEHILLGLVREGEGVAATVLVRLGADLGRVRQQVLQVMSGRSGTSAFPAVQTIDVAGEAAVGERASVRTEPRCPRCGVSVSESARFRTIAVRSDTQDLDQMSMDVVYCVRCGSTLHMFKSERPD